MFTQLNINAGLAFGAFAIALFCFAASLKRNLSRIQHATYLIICLSCLVCPLTGIAEELFLVFGKDGDGLLWLFMGSEVLFFVFHSFLAPSFGLYVLSLNGTLVGRRKRLWLIYWIPCMIVELANIANIFFPRDARPLYTVTVGEAGNYLYQRGDYMFIFYIVAALYVLLSLFAFIRNIRALNARKIASLISFYVATLAGVFIQLFWKDIKFEAFFESISILGLLVLLESDTGIINNNTGLYNEMAFYNDNATAMGAKRKYTIITIQSPDYFQYLEMLGQTNYNGIELLVARYLTTIVKSQYVYHLSNGAYGIMVYDERQNDVDMIVQMLENRLAEPFGYGAIEASPRWTITVAKVPNDIEDASQLHYLFAGKNGSFEKKVIIRDSLSLRFIKRRSQIQGAIARGLRDHNFKVYYQPIWDASRNKIVSAEALLRLIDPELGFIGPDEFIPVAEENGTIIELGHWVFEEACRFAKNNEIKDLGIEWLEINLSVYQLPEKDLPGRFLEIAHRYDLPPSFLNIEITETADASNDNELLDRIQNLVKVGFPLSLDDYGTGYSTFSRLIKSKFRTIKIDRSLLLSAEQGPIGKSVLSSIYKTMNGLSFRTIQEGVETEAQKNLILSFGAQMIQGYFFSKPIPGDEFIEYVMKFNKIKFIA